MKFFWKQFRYRLEFLGCLLIAEGVPRLPRRVCVSLAHFLGELFYHLDGNARRTALENLRLALGDSVGPAERERIALASFRNFGRAMFDLFWGRNLSQENFSRHIRAEGFAQAHAAVAQTGAGIFLALHAGSHEWVCLTGGYVGFPSTMVALDFKNPLLDTIFRRAREHSGNRLMGQRQSMLRLLRALRRGGAGLLVDLNLRLDQPGEIIDTFGMKMHATFLHALLHARTGMPLIPVTNIPHADGTCTVTAHPPLFFPPGASRHTIVQGCWDFFEPFIRARPELWLWNYKHWRYRPGNTMREYPFYAHFSKKFERVLADGEDGGLPPVEPAAADHNAN